MLSRRPTRCKLCCVNTLDQTAPARPGRGRRAPRTSGDERERAILETAERLLADRALGEISVDEVARGAGISRPTFYFYFASKEAVVLSLIESMVEQAESRLGEVLAEVAQHPRAGLRKGIEDFFESFRAHRAVIKAGIELRASSAEARALWTQVMEQRVEEVTALIEDERARGAAPAGPPARELAIALLQMNERAQQATIAGEAPAIAEDGVIDVLLEVWLRAIYGPSAPA
jgi:TetR/AcrR family transcriptional regulator, ethionamide resistance regulator